MLITKRDGSKNYYVVFMFQGKQIVRSCKTPNKALATQVGKKIHDQIVAEQMLGEGPEITLHKALDLYKASMVHTPNFRNLEHQTRWVQTNITDIPLHQIDEPWLNRYVAARSLQSAQATVKLFLVLIRQTILFCKKMGYKHPRIEEWPKVKVKNQRVEFLTEEEEKALLAELDPTKPMRGVGIHKIGERQDLQDFVVFLIDTGTRFSEASAIKWSDVDFERKVLHIYRQKTSSQSVLPISQRLLEILKRRYSTKNSEWVFSDRTGTRPKQYAVQALQKAAVRAGITKNVTPHLFRHTAISRLTKAGLSIPKLQKFSGHSTTACLYRYIHLTEGDVVDEIRGILDKD